MSALSLNERLQNLSTGCQLYKTSLDGNTSYLTIHDLEPIRKELAALQDCFANLQQEVALLHLPRWDARRKLLVQIQSDLQSTSAKVQQIRYGMVAQCVSGPVTREVDADFLVLERASSKIQEAFRNAEEPLNPAIRDGIGLYCANAKHELETSRLSEKSEQLIDGWYDEVHFNTFQ